MYYIPVSYTHLDVYKRQVLLLFTLMGLTSTTLNIVILIRLDLFFLLYEADSIEPPSQILQDYSNSLNVSVYCTVMKSDSTFDSIALLNIIDLCFCDMKYNKKTNGTIKSS